MDSQDIRHVGSDTKGNDYEVVITPGKFFRCYDVKGTWGMEVVVTENHISLDIPDGKIKTPEIARAWAALLMEAADELERQNED